MSEMVIGRIVLTDDGAVSLRLDAAFLALGGLVANADVELLPDTPESPRAATPAASGEPGERVVEPFVIAEVRVDSDGSVAQRSRGKFAVGARDFPEAIVPRSWPRDVWTAARAVQVENGVQLLAPLCLACRGTGEDPLGLSPLVAGGGGVCTVCGGTGKPAYTTCIQGNVAPFPPAETPPTDPPQGAVEEPLEPIAAHLAKGIEGLSDRLRDVVAQSGLSQEVQETLLAESQDTLRSFPPAGPGKSIISGGWPLGPGALRPTDDACMFCGQEEGCECEVPMTPCPSCGLRAPWWVADGTTKLRCRDCGHSEALPSAVKAALAVQGSMADDPLDYPDRGGGTFTPEPAPEPVGGDEDWVPPVAHVPPPAAECEECGARFARASDRVMLLGAALCRACAAEEHNQ